jgi:hypothetical protein
MADPHSAPASRRPAFGVGARTAPSSGIGGRTASANPAARQHGSESDPASASARAPAPQHPLRTADARTPWHRLRIEQGCEAGGSCSCASAVGGDSSGTPYRPPSDEELAEWGAHLDDQLHQIRSVLASRPTSGRATPSVPSGRATPQLFQHQPTQQPPAFTSPQPSCFSCGAGVPFDLSAALEALGQATDRHARSGAQTTQGGHQPHQGAQGGQGGVGGIQQGHVEAALVVLASAFGAHLQPSTPGPITPPQPTHTPSSRTGGDEASKGKAKGGSGGPRSAGKTEKRKTKARAPPSPPSPPSSDGDDDSSSDDSSSDESSSGEDSEMGEHDSSRKRSKGIKGLSSKRLGTIESDCNPATLIADQRNFREVLSRHNPRLARVLKADERRWKEMKKEKKYKEANKFVADAWYDSRKSSVYVDNMKREIPSKRVNDGRFILARELDTKTAKLGAEVLTAEAKFEKLTFKGAKDLAQVKDRSFKIQGEYLTLPGKSESSIGPAEVQLMLIGKMPDSHAAARAALKLEFLQRECEGALWTVVTVERRIALALGSAANEANANSSNQGGKGDGGKGGGRKGGGGDRDTRSDTAGSGSCYNCGKPGHSARDCEERGKCGCKNCPCCHGDFCIIGANKKIVPDGSNHTKAKNAVGGQLSKMILERLRDKQKKKKPALYRGANAHEADGQEEGEGEEQGDESEPPEGHVSDFGTAVHPHARGGPTLHASHGGWQAPEGWQHPSKGRGRGSGGGKGAGRGSFRPISQLEADEASDDGAGTLTPAERNTSLDAIVDSSGDDASSSDESSNPPSGDDASSSDESSNPPSLSAASTSESGSDDGFDKQQLKAAVAQSLVQESELDQAEKEADRELQRALKEARVTEKLERAARIREENQRRREAQREVDFPPLGAPTPSLGSSLPGPAFVATRRPSPPEGWTTVKKRAGKAKALQANCGGQPQRKMA